MQTNRKQLDIYLVILAILTLATVVLRTLATLLQYDSEYGYYTGGSLIVIANAICVSGVFILISHFASYPKDVSFTASFSTPMTYIPTGIVSIALLFLSVSLVSYVSAVSPFPLLSAATLRTPTYFLALASALLAVASIPHFFLNSFIKEPHDTARASAAFLTIIFLSIYPAYLYFNSRMPINSPNKIIDQMAYLSVAIFFLYELRISLGRERWRSYISFGLVAALLTAYSSIPALITYFAKGEAISDSINESILTFTLFIFVAFRLILVRFLYTEEPSPVVTKIIELHTARSQEIGDSDLIIAEPKQLSFDMFYNEEPSKESSPIATDEEPEDLSDDILPLENDLERDNDGNDELKQINFEVPDTATFETEEESSSSEFIPSEDETNEENTGN